jgi:hypothetical protein
MIRYRSFRILSGFKLVKFLLLFGMESFYVISNNKCLSHLFRTTSNEMKPDTLYADDWYRFKLVNFLNISINMIIWIVTGWMEKHKSLFSQKFTFCWKILPEICKYLRIKTYMTFSLRISPHKYTIHKITNHSANLLNDNSCNIHAKLMKIINVFIRYKTNRSFRNKKKKHLTSNMNETNGKNKMNNCLEKLRWTITSLHDESQCLCWNSNQAPHKYEHFCLSKRAVCYKKIKCKRDAMLYEGKCKKDAVKT